MLRPPTTLILALCASLIVHAALMLIASRTPVVELAQHTPDDHRPEPVNRPIRFLPLPTRWGEAEGLGVALHAAPGDQPLAAPEGHQDQAFVSRDPIGPARHFPPQPSESTSPPGAGAGQARPEDPLADRIAQPTPPARVPPAPPHPPASRPEPSPLPPAPPVDLSAVTETRMPATPPPAPSPQSAPHIQTVSPAPTPVVPTTPVAALAAPSTLRPPGPQVAPADPAVDAELESDPFSRTPGVEFRNGKVEARSGRQVKPVRPRLTEASRRDLLALRFPTILLKVRIDDTGKVQDVRVLRGSGSEAIDMPVYRALWHWWFEPPKDQQGKPLPDVQLVAIHWG